MKLFDVMGIHHPEVTPEQSKIHLAVFNGTDHPIDVFRDGQFEPWQASQSKANFTRPYVVSLIRMLGSRDRWLFAGIYEVKSFRPHPTVPKPAVLYETRILVDPGELVGRLVASFTNSKKQMVRKGETVAADIAVAEFRAMALSNLLFTGFLDIRLSKSELDRILRKSDPEWAGPLSAVQGIYVITDLHTGRVYVGSACGWDRNGERGIWARWKHYGRSGHGDNLRLRALLETHGAEYANNFQFSILEVLSPQASSELVKSREGHWKRVLASVQHGYNDNLEKDVLRAH